MVSSYDGPRLGELPAVDLHDVSRCPLGHRCESCGAETAELTVQTRTVEVLAGGTICLTMCPPCAVSSVDPPITVGTAARLLAAHCAHLGCAGGAR